MRCVKSNLDRIHALKIVGRAASSTEATDVQGERAPEGSVPGREFDWAILMARAQVGEQEAYRRLLDEITPYLRSLAAKAHRDRSDIEDTVQDVLLTVHSIRHTYDPSRPFGPWLVAIAHRRIVDRLRRQGRAAQHETSLAPEHETLAAAEANYFGEGVDFAAVHDAVERLPPGQRDAIKLMKLQEMSLREAATVSGMSVAALKVATYRRIKNLRKLFNGPAGS